MADEEKSVLQVIVELVDKVSEPLKGIKEDFDSFSDSVHQIWAAGAEVFAGYEADQRSRRASHGHGAGSRTSSSCHWFRRG